MQNNMCHVSYIIYDRMQHTSKNPSVCWVQREVAESRKEGQSSALRSHPSVLRFPPQTLVWGILAFWVWGLEVRHFRETSFRAVRAMGLPGPKSFCFDIPGKSIEVWNGLSNAQSQIIVRTEGKLHENIPQDPFLTDLFQGGRCNDEASADWVC